MTIFFQNMTIFSQDMKGFYQNNERKNKRFLLKVLKILF